MSLQNPSGRPSMIGRAITANGTVATTTSWSWRALASVSPTWAYSGSVKLPDRIRRSADREFLVLHRVGGGQVSVLRGVRHQHEAPRDVAGGEHMRDAGAQMRVDLHVTAVCGCHRGGGQVQPGGVREPADRDDDRLRLDAVHRGALLEHHPDTSRRLLEAADPTEVLAYIDVRGPERGGHGARDVLVLGRQNPGSGLEESNVGTEFGEDRRYLDAGRARADHQQRLRHGGQRPGVAVRPGQLGTGNR